MGYDIKLMAGSSMPFGQFKYLLVSSVGGFPAPGSWQVFPPSILGSCLYSLWQQNELLSLPTLFVGQKPHHSLLIR